MSSWRLIEKLKLLRRSSKYFWWVTSIVAIIILLGGGALFQKFHHTAADDKVTDSDKKTFPVAVEISKRRELKQYFSTYSFLLPRKEVTLRPNQNVTIREVTVEVGQTVTKGKIIAYTDSEVQNLRAELEQIDSKLRNLDFNVTVALAKKSFLSSKEYQEKELQHKANKIRQRLAEIETAGALLAPIDGMISEINLKAGDYIDNPSQYSMKIVDPSKFRIQLYLPQNVAVKLHKGDDVILSRNEIDDHGTGENASAPAQITAISPVVDQKSGAVFTEIETETEKVPKSWIAGQYIEVKLTTKKSENAVTVPNASLIYENNAYYLFKISNTKEAQGELKPREPASTGGEGENEVTIAQKVPVTIGIKNSHYTEIISGVNEYDMIVLEGQGSLSEGSKVDIVRFEKGQ